MDTLLISNGRLTARVAPFGATLTDLRLAGWHHPLVLGFETIEDYRDSDHQAGAIMGRHANRIANGWAANLGLTLPRNGGAHHLHGGVTGVAKQHWDVVSADGESVTLRYLSRDGHEGYPGNCTITVRYAAVRNEQQ